MNSPKNGHNWTSDDIRSILRFPVVAYHKYNGFLGLISYNKKLDKLFVCSKSTNEGTYAKMVQEGLDRLETKDLVVDFLKKNDVTMIFEVIDRRDPHIIKYDEDRIVLLDIVTNSFEPEYLAYDALVEVSKMLGLECKKKDYEFNTFEELYTFKKKQDVNFDNEIEGWVFTDSNLYRVKYKTPFYKWWKMMRGVKDSIAKGRKFKQVFATKQEIEVVNFMKSIDPEELDKMSIIEVREKYKKCVDKQEN